jgi:hypothetical protein
MLTMSVVVRSWRRYDHRLRLTRRVSRIAAVDCQEHFCSRQNIGRDDLDRGRERAKDEVQSLE